MNNYNSLLAFTFLKYFNLAPLKVVEVTEPIYLPLTERLNFFCFRINNINNQSLNIFLFKIEKELGEMK